MRSSIVLVVLVATAACVPASSASRPAPALSARSLDTTIDVGAAENRRALAAQVQTCRTHIETSINLEAIERVNVQQRRATLVAGLGGVTSLLTWFVIRQSARHGPGGLDAVIVVTLLGGAVLHVVQASILRGVP